MIHAASVPLCFLLSLPHAQTQIVGRHRAEPSLLAGVDVQHLLPAAGPAEVDASSGLNSTSVV